MSADRLLALWRRVSLFPGGRFVFALAIRVIVPYSGTIRARVLELEPGRARLAVRDRRRIRNHLRSVHAIALANLGELTSGLALTTALPRGVRAILTGLDVTYSKKARGTLVAESVCSPPEVQGDVDFTVSADIRDRAGDVVATVIARWRLGL